jgi:Domain of unknown function (DUF4430)
MVRWRALALLLALLLAGCGGTAGEEAGGGGTASLWVTRDRGAEVLFTAEVPAGLTVLQALDREADVQTRYGGRFVQAIEGVQGSLSAQRDWFYFLNGIEPDVGAADVRLRPGDVAWWDFRSWTQQMQQPVVVGAFPEPLLHGWAGHARPVEVQAPAELDDAAAALREALSRAGGEGDPNLVVLEVRPDDSGAELAATRGSANDSPVTFTLFGSEGAVRAAALALAADPSIVRYRYTARFDDQGVVIE